MDIFGTILLATQPVDEGAVVAAAAAVGGIFLLWLLGCFSSSDQRLWLNCPRCNELSSPIEKTKDRYRCPSCSQQFAGAPH